MHMTRPAVQMPRPFVWSLLWQCFSFVDQLTFSCSLCAAHGASGPLGSRFTWKTACDLVNTGETGPFEWKRRGMELGRHSIGNGQTQLQPVHRITNPAPISRSGYLAATDWPRLFWNSDFISGDLLCRAPVWFHWRPQVHQKTQNLIVETFPWCCPPLCRSKFTVRQLFQCL